MRALLPEDARPTVYVIERYGLSDTLILEQACKEAGLPSPYAAADRLPIKRRRAVVALSRRPRLFGRSPHRTRSEALSLLADGVRADPDKDVRVVPVSIFVGRAPDRESGWFSVLFSENWVVVGRFRRLLALALNGRDTHVQFAAPVSLREVIADQPDTASRASFVAEVGNAWSDAAVLARELGVPMVSGLSPLGGLLAPGERVRVDGARGLVERLEGRAS